MTSPSLPSPKLVLRLKDPKRFRLASEQERNGRLQEQWTRSMLIDETYLSLMSVKEEDSSVRKYEEQVRKKLGWMVVSPHVEKIIVSLKDLDAKVKQELLKDNTAMRNFTLKQAVGMICEQVDSRYYLLSAKRHLKVELVD